MYNYALPMKVFSVYRLFVLRHKCNKILIWLLHVKVQGTRIMTSSTVPGHSISLDHVFDTRARIKVEYTETVNLW